MTPEMMKNKTAGHPSTLKTGEYDSKGRRLPKKLKEPVAEDLRTRGLLVNKAQEALADAAASEDLKQMAELLDAGAGLAHQRGHRWHCGRWWRFRVVLLDHAGALYGRVYGDPD